MRVLREGVSGPDVLAWQRFIRSVDNLTVVDETSVFDKATVTATMKFQLRSGFVGRDVDGVVGPKTLLFATKMGFAPPTLATALPKRPDQPPLTPSARAALFGTFTYKPAGMVTNPEAIIITDDWPNKNIQTVTIPQLVNVRGASSGRVTLNAKIVPQFVTLFKRIEDEGLLQHVVTWDGGWVPRFIRGSKVSLSNHSWGTAFDINARWNPYGQVPAAAGQYGSTCEIVSLAYECGFYWGGWFTHRPDGMHFECYKLV